MAIERGSQRDFGKIRSQRKALPRIPGWGLEAGLRTTTVSVITWYLPTCSSGLPLVSQYQGVEILFLCWQTLHIHQVLKGFSAQSSLADKRKIVFKQSSNRSQLFFSPLCSFSWTVHCWSGLPTALLSSISDFRFLSQSDVQLHPPIGSLSGDLGMLSTFSSPSFS